MNKSIRRIGCKFFRTIFLQFCTKKETHLDMCMIKEMMLASKRCTIQGVYKGKNVH